MTTNVLCLPVVGCNRFSTSPDGLWSQQIVDLDSFNVTSFAQMGVGFPNVFPNLSHVNISYLLLVAVPTKTNCFIDWRTMAENKSLTYSSAKVTKKNKKQEQTVRCPLRKREVRLDRWQEGEGDIMSWSNDGGGRNAGAAGCTDSVSWEENPGLKIIVSCLCCH